MKERDLKKRVDEILKISGYVVWWPPKVRFLQNDIFGVFDCVAAKDDAVLFIQITTLTNVSHRRKKINDFLYHSKVSLSAQIWAWDDKKAGFRIFDLNDL